MVNSICLAICTAYFRFPRVHQLRTFGRSVVNLALAMGKRFLARCMCSSMLIIECKDSGLIYPIIMLKVPLFYRRIQHCTLNFEFCFII